MSKKAIKTKNTYLVSSSTAYYDDCPICRTMKKAEEEGRNLSQHEVDEAFSQAAKNGGIVGGMKNEDELN